MPDRSLTTWVGRGIGSATETYQYAVLVVVLGVVTTVADLGSDAGGEPAASVLGRLLDVPFVQAAAATEPGRQLALAALVIAVILLLAVTAVALPVLHQGTVLVRVGEHAAPLSPPALTVFGFDIDVLLAAVPIVVVGVVAAGAATETEGQMAPRTVLRAGLGLGVAHAITVLAIAVLAREVLFAFATAIVGPGATEGVTITVLTPGTVAVVTSYAVGVASVGVATGQAIRERARE
ncbi:MAG: hypothetical protein ABEJ57_00590 [Halobacteriaceae archaeon]